MTGSAGEIERVSSAAGRLGRSTAAGAVLALLIAVAATLCFTSVNSRYGPANDPQGQMVVSENILRHHSLSIDNLGPDDLAGLTYHISRAKNGRIYYYFPFGTTLAAVPLVAALDALGWDMRRDEAAAEHVACALLAGAMILLLYGTARALLPPVESALLSGLMWFGTSLSSTGATALWGHLTATTCAALAVWIAVRHPALRSPLWRTILGGALFMAYLSRPTMALLSPAVLLFVACRSWRSALWAGGVVAGLLALFLSANIRIFGEPLPLFYAGNRLGSSTFLTALYGNLLSPSRGLLVFSPFLALPVLAIPLIWRGAGRPLLILALGWPVAHVVAVSSFDRWWGGYSFGPRYTMEVLPGLFVLLCLAWAAVRGRRAATGSAAALAFLGAAAILIHVGAGLEDAEALSWNVAADIDGNPRAAFDWRYPQWLATEGRNADLAALTAASKAQPR